MAQTRAERLEPVDRLMRDAERAYARRFADAEQCLADAEQRCRELERYRAEYLRSFQERAQSGLSAQGLREYQTFIARLDEALVVQRGRVQQLKSERSGVRVGWRVAAVRSSAVGKVIEGARREELLTEERRLQREIDERAQRNGGRG